MKFTHTILGRCIKVLLLATVLAFPLVIEAAELENWDVRIESGYIPSADVGKSVPVGEAEEIFARIALSLPIPLSDSSHLRVKISGEQAFFDWVESDNIAFSNGRDPWDNLYSSDIGLRYLHKWNRSWSTFLGGGLGAAWEEEMDDSYSYSGNMGAMYRSSPSLIWTFGVAFTKGPEDSRAFPILGLAWNQSRPGESGEYQSGWSVSLGIPRTEIRYSVNRMWDFYCNMGMHRGTYRLAEDSEVSPSGLVEMERYESGLFVDIRPAKQLTLCIGMVYHFGREWEIQDAGGNEIQEVDIDDAVGLKFALRWIF